MPDVLGQSFSHGHVIQGGAGPDGGHRLPSSESTSFSEGRTSLSGPSLHPWPLVGAGGGTLCLHRWMTVG